MKTVNELHIRYIHSNATDMDYTVIKALGYSSATLAHNHEVNMLWQYLHVQKHQTPLFKRSTKFFNRST
jgi:hypothetical protein